MLLAGCSSARVDLTAPSGWSSAIVSLEIDGARENTAHDGSSPIVMQAPEGADVEVVGVFYPGPLADLGVEPGVIAAGTRALPPSPLAPRARRLLAGVVGAEESLAFSDPRVARIQLPEIDSARCEARGACLEIGLGERSCVSACDPAGTITPAPPAAPQIAPCDSGWVEVDGECRPPPMPARLACPPDRVQRRDDSACVAVGAPCPAGDWPTALPPGPARFVHPAGAPGPQGEVSFRSVADALAGAPAGAVVVLSRGLFSGDAALGDATLVGACPEATAFLSSLHVTGATRLSGFTLRGGMTVDRTATVTLAGMTFEGIDVFSDGRIAGDDVFLRALLSVRQGGSAALTRVVVNFPGIIRPSGAGTQVELDDLVSEANIEIDLGAFAHVSRALFLGGGAIVTRGSTLALEIADLIGGTTPTGAPLQSAIGSTIRARRVSIERATARALEANVGATLTFEDGWIHPLAGSARTDLVFAAAQSELRIARTTIAEYPLAAIHSDFATVALTDVRLRDPLPSPDQGELAVLCDNHSGLVVSRVSITQARTMGITLFNTSTATIGDLLIDGLADGAGTERPSGVRLSTSDARLSRVRIKHAVGTPLYDDHRSRMRATDIDIDDTAGAAIHIYDGSSFEGRNILVRTVGGDTYAPGYGVLTGSGAVLDLQDATITGAREANILVKHTPESGYPPPDLTLRNVTLSRSRVGLSSALVPDLIFGLSMDGVRFIEDAVDIQR